ncbi:major cell surface glycoprotein [Halopenitus malekzadehii]|uniref:Cell surface glycoprotein n=1 Tax=Halopenitus malekzadehii TaxID=1267564 RepID=A0A1H6J162_9EURY|nr:HVO_2072 family ArtA-dependent S-layer glycoprotein [Halopenitus malekzadehii]SEH53166.1 major cell surface glycoprotein [Halopenitus malekzadehii]
MIDETQTERLRAVLLASLMVLSVFAGTMAFAGGAAAQQADSRSPGSATVAPGGTVDVTVEISSDQQNMDLYTEEIVTGSGVANITSASSQQTQVPTDLPSDSFEAVYLASVDSDTLEYTVSVDDQAQDGETIEVSGTIVDSSANETDTGTTTITVSDDQQPPDNGNGDGNSVRGDAPANSWSTADGAGDVGNGATIFQGEESITFVDANGDEVSPSSLERTAGADEGVPLSMPIPQDQSTGSYETTDGSFGVTVQTPRVTTLEVQNNGGSDVSGGILTTDQDNARVVFDYNYDDAEDLELTVEDENGLDVTDEIVEGSDTLNDEGNGAFAIDPNAVDAGEYTFSVAGVEDLDFGSATESVTVTISSDRTASLNLDSDEVVQGQNLQYTIENSPEGNFHAVVIDSSDFRDGVTVDQAKMAFRNVGDTAETGVVADDGAVNPDNVDVSDIDYAYAVVEIDDGNGVGSVETQHLDDSSIDIDLYPAGASISDGALTGDVTGVESDDDASFDVTEGDVSLDSPSGAYVVGSEVDVNGTANEGVDEVAIYARDNNEFELVHIDDARTVEVDSDNSFEEEDVTISQGDGGGNNLLTLPGTYRLGVIDAADADIDSTEGVDDTLSTSNFNSGVSSTSSISVTDTELDGSFTTINGQVATEDGQVDVEGTAPGKDELVVAFVDSRGNAAAYDITVDGDGTFDEEDLNIGDLSEGTLSAHIISSGRDGSFGDGVADNAGDFADLIVNDYAGGASTGNQVRDRILANSVEDTASDDLIVTENFRLASGLTTIESATDPVALDGTLTVEGTTNRDSEDNTITVELLNEDGDSITIDSTDEWDTDGQWSVELDLSEADLETGTYTVESDDGDNTDRVDIEVVEEVEETETTEPTEEPTEEPTTEPTEEPTEEPTTEATEEPADTTEPSESETPGFGAVVALVALVAAALLAVRRRP